MADKSAAGDDRNCWPMTQKSTGVWRKNTKKIHRPDQNTVANKKSLLGRGAAYPTLSQHKGLARPVLKWQGC